MRLWYLSHRRPAKTQASLRIRAISPEPSLFAHMKYGRRRRVQPKFKHLAPPDAVHACLKNFTEDKKCHNFMSWINFYPNWGLTWKGSGVFTELSNKNYKLLGVDLSQVNTLEAALKLCDVDFDVPTLFLSEVVLTYMTRRW